VVGTLLASTKLCVDVAALPAPDHLGPAEEHKLPAGGEFDEPVR
jgi:hypothetical protein